MPSSSYLPEHTERRNSAWLPSLFDAMKRAKNSSPSGPSPTLPFAHTPFSRHTSIPKRFYRSRVVSLAICLTVGLILYALAAAIPEDVDHMQLQSGMSLLRGPSTALGTAPNEIVPEEEEEEEEKEGDGEGDTVEDDEEDDTTPPSEDLPPLYPEYFAYEETLLQHHNPEANKKYIHFANHVHLLGFNNHLEEYLVNAHLAFLANRSMVVYEYTWNPEFEREPYSEWFGRKIPSRIPQSVLLGGWLGEETMQNVTSTDEWDLTPVSRPYFNEHCPMEERVYISADEVMDSQISSWVDVSKYPESAGKRVRDGNGIQLLQAWVARLEQGDVRDAKCVEIAKDTGHAFDVWLFGSPSLHTIWESLVHSPVLQHWSFSPLIYAAFRRNAVQRGILGPTVKDLVEAETAPATTTTTTTTDGADGTSVVDGITYDRYGYPAYPGGYPYPPIYTPDPAATKELGPGEVPFEQRSLNIHPYPRTPQSNAGEGAGTLPLLVLHLRRGDFEEHCDNLAEWGSSFMGFSSFEEFAQRDGFVPPEVVEEQGDTADVSGGDEADELGRRDEARAHGSVRLYVAASGGVVSNSTFLGYTYTDRDPRAVKSMDERKEMYRRHCYPQTEQIVRRVKEVVHDWAGMRWISWVETWERSRAADAKDNVGEYEQALEIWKNETLSRLKGIYIMTNGDRTWAEEVREGLRGGSGVGQWDMSFQADVEIQNESGGERKSMKRQRSLEWVVGEWPWDAYYPKGEPSFDQANGGEHPIVQNGKGTPTLITTARDLELNKEEKYVSQAVDMYIGQRAEVFIGNGFSSMTANVVMLRKKDCLDPLQTRFW